MVKRSLAERARHARAAAAAVEPTTTTPGRPIVTETVVVHPTTTAKAATTATPVKPTVATTPAAAKVTTSTTSTSVSTSLTSTSTSVLPKTTSTSTSLTPTTTSTTSSSSTASAPRALTTSSAFHSTTTIAPTPSDASNAASSATQRSGGLSGAAIGGIVAACVLAALALLIFAIRKTFIQRRKRKRNTWGAGMYPEYTDKVDPLDLPPPLPEKVSTPMSASGFGTGLPSPRTPVWAAPRPESIVRQPVNAPLNNVGNGYQNLAPPQMQAQPQQNSYYVTPPPMSYNNPVDDVYGALSPAPSNLTPGASMANMAAPTRSASPSVEMAMVRVVYIPSLPDELSVNVGETVRVVKAFDDGWALCSNARGEQGVVPLECLDRSVSTGNNYAPMRLSVAQSGSSIGYGQENGSDWRNMKRISSLSSQQPHY